MNHSKQIGGFARAAKLSPKRRSEIASVAAKARWLKYRLTHDKKLDNLSKVIAKSKKATDIKLLSIESKIFGKLLKGQSLVLAVTDSRLPKKKRIEPVLLYFNPLSENKILVSMPGYGAEIFTLDKKLKPIVFMMLGLNSALAKALTNALIGIL